MDAVEKLGKQIISPKKSPNDTSDSFYIFRKKEKIARDINQSKFRAKYKSVIRRSYILDIRSKKSYSIFFGTGTEELLRTQRPQSDLTFDPLTEYKKREIVLSVLTSV